MKRWDGVYFSALLRVLKGRLFCQKGGFISNGVSHTSQSFEGNNNYDTPELRTFPPLSTRFIRIYPERATHGGLGLRMELLGCELEGNYNSQSPF